METSLMQVVRATPGKAFDLHTRDLPGYVVHSTDLQVTTPCLSPSSVIGAVTAYPLSVIFKLEIAFSRQQYLLQTNHTHHLHELHRKTSRSAK